MHILFLLLEIKCKCFSFFFFKFFQRKNTVLFFETEDSILSGECVSVVSLKVIFFFQRNKNMIFYKKKR